jgi:cell division protein FtsQ
MSGVKRKPRAAAQPAMPAAFSRMPDRPGRWKLIWRRQKQILRQAMAGAALIAVIGVAGLVMQALGNGASLRDRLGDATGMLGLRVDTIRIDGRQKTPEPLLRAALGVREGDSILGFSVADARARIETIAWVQAATVERRLPGEIVVQLVERRPFAVWQLDGKFTLVDRDGAMVADSDVATFADQLPLIVGPGAPKAAAALLDMLAGQPDIQTRVVAAVRVGDRRWNLRMNNGADVLLPEGAEVQALARLAQLQATHALLDRPLQAVDLRLPDRLVIRPAGDKPAVTRKPT